MTGKLKMAVTPHGSHDPEPRLAQWADSLRHATSARTKAKLPSASGLVRRADRNRNARRSTVILTLLTVSVFFAWNWRLGVDPGVAEFRQAAGAPEAVVVEVFESVGERSDGPLYFRLGDEQSPYVVAVDPLQPDGQHLIFMVRPEEKRAIPVGYLEPPQMYSVPLWHFPPGDRQQVRTRLVADGGRAVPEV